MPRPVLRCGNQTKTHKSPTLPSVMSLRVYVAGAWKDRASIATVINSIRALGCTITHDWTDTNEGENPTRAAMADVDGVRRAELVLLLMTDPTYAYRGSFTELGVALGVGVRDIIIVGNATAAAATNVFWHHADIIHCSELDDAIALVTSKQAERGRAR